MSRDTKFVSYTAGEKKHRRLASPVCGKSRVVLGAFPRLCLNQSVRVTETRNLETTVTV